MAVILKRLALPKSALEQLPDNYAAAVQSGLESRAMQGIAIPMGSGTVRTYPRGEREARWKLGQKDYLRLVEYARSAPGGP